LLGISAPVLLDHLSEDRRIRRHAVDRAVLHERLEPAGLEHLAGDRVEPDRLPSTAVFDGHPHEVLQVFYPSPKRPIPPPRAPAAPAHRRVRGAATVVFGGSAVPRSPRAPLLHLVWLSLPSGSLR